MAEGRSGTQKRRSWGKRHKGKVISLDQMDIEELTKLQTSKRIHSSDNSSSAEDKQHPELMSNQALVNRLSEMKVAIPVYSDGQPSRERLLYLFWKHVTPKPQRSGFWRRRMPGEVKGVVQMDVDHNQDTWISSNKSWDSPLLGKRCSQFYVCSLIIKVAGL